MASGYFVAGHFVVGHFVVGHFVVGHFVAGLFRHDEMTPRRNNLEPITVYSPRYVNAKLFLNILLTIHKSVLSSILVWDYKFNQISVLDLLFDFIECQNKPKPP
jgi:hypothetical protein